MSVAIATSAPAANVEHALRETALARMLLMRPRESGPAVGPQA